MVERTYNLSEETLRSLVEAKLCYDAILYGAECDGGSLTELEFFLDAFNKAFGTSCATLEDTINCYMLEFLPNRVNDDMEWE